MADDLKEFCGRRLKEHMNPVPEGKLTEERFKAFWAAELSEIVEEVYGNTTCSSAHNDIRMVVCDTVVKGLLSEKPSPWHPLTEMLKTYGEFGAVVLGKYADGVREGHGLPANSRRATKCRCGYKTTVCKPDQDGAFTWGFSYLRCPHPNCGNNITCNWNSTS